MTDVLIYGSAAVLFIIGVFCILWVIIGMCFMAQSNQTPDRKSQAIAFALLVVGQIATIGPLILILGR